MAALPYMQFYVADYLADTAHLTTEEHGAYLLLLFSYWQTGKPLKADRLASIARLSNERWTSVERTLSEFFHVQKGVWIHFRVEADLEKVAKKSKKNSESGKASAKARALAKQALEEGDSTNAAANVATNAEETFNHARSGDTDTDTDTEDQKHLSPQADDGTEKPSKPKPEKPPFDWIMAKYNEICGHSFKKAATLTDARRKNITKCWSRKVSGKLVFQSGGFWKEYFTWCLREPYWHGKPGESWKASLEFVTRHDIVDRVIDEMTAEGVFDNE